MGSTAELLVHFPDSVLQHTRNRIENRLHSGIECWSGQPRAPTVPTRALSVTIDADTMQIVCFSQRFVSFSFDSTGFSPQLPCFLNKALCFLCNALLVNTARFRWRACPLCKFIQSFVAFPHVHAQVRPMNRRIANRRVQDFSSARFAGLMRPPLLLVYFPNCCEL